MLQRMRRFAAAALMACIALPGVAAELDCSGMLADLAAKKHGKGIVADAQRHLVELGLDPGGVDDVLGSKTRSELLRFCGRAKFALNADLLLMLRNHAAIHRAYQNWTTTLASKGFQKWEGKQKDAAEIARVELGGNAEEVIAVLDRYRTRRASQALVGSGDDTSVSYLLTKDDIVQLKSREGVAKAMAKLLDATYEDQEGFEAAAGTALKGVADSFEYVQLAERIAEQQTSYRISAKSFDELKVGNVPEYVLLAIQGMKDLNYPGDTLDEAVDAELDKLVERTMAFKPQLITLAKISPAGASLSESSLATFAEAQKDDPLAVVILERLRKLLGVRYKDDKALAWAMQTVLKEISDQIDKSRSPILAHAEEVTVYAFDKARAQEIDKKIKDSIVPEIYLALLDDMQGVDYPDPELFWLATKARVAMLGSNNPLRKSIRGVIESRAADKMDELLLEELKAAKLHPAVLGLLGTLQGQKFDDAKALESAIDGLFAQLGELYEQYRPVVIEQARKTHPFDKSKNILWDGKSCNCVHSNLAGEIYGFYPYWMAGDKQAIDFSVQTRIGYYGLTFDDKGNIPNASRWTGLDAGFIREARTYGAKVDLVIYRNDWRGWDQSSNEEKAALFENLVANIVALVDTPLTDTFSKVKPYISMGTNPPPVMGDGVTLYFSGYPQDADAVDAFDGFIRALRDKLKSGGRKYSVNLMFRSAELGKGVYDYPRLLSLVDNVEGSDENDKELDALFLVLLQEPTTYDKKMLRLNIENGLHGKDRMKLQRNVAMVLTYDGRNESQLLDDVIYAKDNFGGIGFWTQPVISGVDPTADSSTLASDVLHDNFLNSANGASAAKPAVCQYVCPNRWAFRITWDIFLLVLLASIPLYILACDWRNLFNRYFLHFLGGVVAPFLLLTFALLFCDPAWERISKGNGLLILVIAIALAYIVWNYYDKKRKADLP
jgi:hypothetical protein